MYRRRRNVKNRYGNEQSRFGTKFKIILVAVILLASVSAFITGTLLGRRADSSAYESFERRSLTSFGGVEEPEVDYSALGEITAGFAAAENGEISEFRTDVSELSFGNAVAFEVNNKNGDLLVITEKLLETVVITNTKTLKLPEITELLVDKQKLGVAVFHSTVSYGKDDASRAFNAAREFSIISELDVEGIGEIVIKGISDETDSLAYLKPYLLWINNLCESNIICVALDYSHVKGTGATRIINATKGYADAYAIDLAGLSTAELGDAIERCAYFITNYNMRLIVRGMDAADTEEKIALLDSYGIKSYYFVGANAENG